MHLRTNTDTRFHIDLAWWPARGRNLRRFLSEMLDAEDADLPDDTPLDYIDPVTAEVYRLDPLWVRVLTDRANRPGFITPATPLSIAILRALIENLNRPMTVGQLHRRINRSSPESLLKLMHTVRVEYGIVPVADAPHP